METSSPGPINYRLVALEAWIDGYLTALNRIQKTFFPDKKAIIKDDLTSRDFEFIHESFERWWHPLG